MGTTVERTIQSLRKVSDFPFFTASYYADYRLDTFTNGSIASLEDIPRFFEELYDGLGYPEGRGLSAKWPGSIGCSAFSTRSQEGKRIVGKNLDWRKGPVLLLRTFPPNGYSSLSIVDLSLGDLFGLQSYIYSLLTSPYVPFDGMNDQGLTVSMLSVETESQYPSPSGKQPVGDFNIIRILLDRCRSVEEAILLFYSFDIIQSGPLPIHYIITDPMESCIVELSGGKIRVSRTEEPVAITNFLKIESPAYEFNRNNCVRYRKMEDFFTRRSGCVSKEEAMRLLGAVAVFQPEYAIPSTIWSVVFSPDDLQLRIRIGNRGPSYRVELTDDRRI